MAHAVRQAFDREHDPGVRSWLALALAHADATAALDEMLSKKQFRLPLGRYQALGVWLDERRSFIRFPSKALAYFRTLRRSQSAPDDLLEIVRFLDIYDPDLTAIRSVIDPRPLGFVREDQIEEEVNNIMLQIRNGKSLEAIDIEYDAIPYLPYELISYLVADKFWKSVFEREGPDPPARDYENNLLIEAILRVGGSFLPDVDGLIECYRALLEQFERVGDSDGVEELRLQIAWAATRRGFEAILAKLGLQLQSEVAIERTIAASMLVDAAMQTDRVTPPKSPMVGGSGEIWSVRRAPPRLHIDLGLKAALEAVSRALEAARFTDLTLYEGMLYGPGDRDGARKLADTDPLLIDRDYTLEVAIRLQRTGLGMDQAPEFAVLNPRRTTEPLEIIVVAAVNYGPVEVENTVARLWWPHDQDSTPAYLRLRRRSLDQASMRAQIEVRLYHSNLDLLDVIRLTVTVATDAQAATLGSEVHWFRDERAQPALDPDTAVRAVTIAVGPATNGYKFTFLFRRGGKEAELTFIRYISAGDLQALLRRARDFWTRLVITTYADKPTVTTTTWHRHLTELRTIGFAAWGLLFGDAEGDSRGAPEEVGDLLRALDIVKGTHVQVSYDESVADFIFPWALLYPPEETNTVDPGRFWGARFQIEQVWHGRKEDGLGTEPVDVAVAIDRGFGQAEAQEGMFADFLARAGGRLSLRRRSTDVTTLLTALRGDPASHLYYFFCHGYAPAGPSVLQPDGVRMLEKAIAEAPEEAQTAWQTLLTLTARMKDEAWIFLGDAEITESALRQAQGFFRTRRPVVFMNMCHSAALLPSMTSGLVRLFLRRSACAVIGTEAPMTSVFAHAFAEQFFTHLLAGCDIGTALLRARLHFLAEDRRNLLSLAYTLYGRATTVVCREAIVPLPAETGAPSAAAATD
jgi:hypothetical protein